MRARRRTHPLAPQREEPPDAARRVGGAGVHRRDALDGLVLATSVFDHSMNYPQGGLIRPRRGAPGTPEGARHGGRAPGAGRWDKTRRPNEREDKGTLAVAVAIGGFSVKSRSGPPTIDAADEPLDAWAGVVRARNGSNRVARRAPGEGRRRRGPRARHVRRPAYRIAVPDGTTGTAAWAYRIAVTVRRYDWYAPPSCTGPSMNAMNSHSDCLA